MEKIEVRFFSGMSGDNLRDWRRSETVGIVLEILYVGRKILYVGRKIAERNKNWHRHLARMNRLSEQLDRLCMTQAAGTVRALFWGGRWRAAEGVALVGDRNEA